LEKRIFQMGENLTQKILNFHGVSGKPRAGELIAISIDQTLFHGATGTMAALQFEALSLPRIKTKLSVAYSGGGFIVAGTNYGQGSSREHAAIGQKSF